MPQFSPPCNHQSMKPKSSALVLAILLCSQSPIGSYADAAGNAAENAVPAEYRISPGDILDISVWKEEGLSKEVLVRPDGGISFPLVGDLAVQGSTVDTVTGQIIERLSGYIAEPVVTVAVKHSNQRFYVVGKVNKPGEILSVSRLNVMQAIAMAGGPTPFANDDDITVIHHTGNRTVSLSFDYAAVSKGEDLEQNITLEPGDVVVVR